jgi:hypothetical protein
MILDALDQLTAGARALGCDVHLGPPAPSVPETILGAPVDPDLRDLLQRHDSVQIRGDAFALFVYGVAGLETIEWSSRGLRSMADDGIAYPFDGLISFAQYAYQASYLCCVPALAGPDGSQPVLYVDTHEAPYGMPVASSVERTVLVLARYVEILATGLDRTFPREIPEIVRADRRLVDRAAAGAFEPWIGAERDWLKGITA